MDRVSSSSDQAGPSVPSTSKEAAAMNSEDQPRNDEIALHNDQEFNEEFDRIRLGK